MRCGILGDRTSEWVAKSQPEVNITPADFDTLTQTFEKAGDTDAALSEWPIGTANETFPDMYITAVKGSVLKGGLWEANITWTGIYPSGTLQTYYWITEGTTVQRQLYKPVESSVRTYTDQVQDVFAITIYRTRTPRLTTTEKYVTAERPDNTEIGKEGRPLNPPSEVELLDSGWPWAAIKNNVEPNGWILNTRSWTQVLDKDLYTISDEWIYQIPQQWRIAE